MATNQEALVKALLEAQLELDAAIRVAEVAGIAMTPSNIRSEDINFWRKKQTDPKHNSQIRTALEKRDRCLLPLGWSVEEWLKRYAAATKKTR